MSENPSILERWGRTVYRRRRLILVIALLVAGLGVLWGTSIFARVQTAGGFDAPNSQSQHEANLATQAFGRDAGDVVVLYSSKTLTAASPTFRSAVTSTLAALPPSKVESYASYWSTGSRQFVSASGHQTYAVIELAGASDTARQDSYDAIKAQLSAPGLQTQLGGVVPTDETIDQQTTASITRAEGAVLPHPADPAAGDLREPDRGVPAAGDRRTGNPGLVHRAAAADPGHRRFGVLPEHHHHPRPRPGHRLRAVPGHPVPGGAA